MLLDLYTSAKEPNLLHFTQQAQKVGDLLRHALWHAVGLGPETTRALAGPHVDVSRAATCP